MKENVSQFYNDEIYISWPYFEEPYLESRLEFNILPGIISIIGWLLFSKSELKFNNAEFNFTKLPKCDEIHFSCPNSIIWMW